MTVYPAPAKLNLFLHVTGRRSNGYHELQTVFQFLDFYDECRFEESPGGRIIVSQPIAGVPVEADLSFRAASLLQRLSGAAKGAKLTIDKKIPTGAGLGGGSSNAATTLIALNRLWRLGLSRHELASIGLNLGADVPIFIHGRAAWAEGIGEDFTDVDPPESLYLIIRPDVFVSTRRIFSDPDLTRNTPPIKIRDFLDGRSRNDLEPVACKLYPRLLQAMDWLRGFGPAKMTGSGSCIYLAVNDLQEGERILAQRPDGVTGFLAKGLNTHPLSEF